MNAKEKYNAMIADIETLASDRYKNEQAVAQLIRQKYGMIDRDLLAIFNFMTGRPAMKYIKERKMMAAYQCIIETEKWNKNLVSKIVDISGASDQSSFGKKFSKTFSISPKEAHSRKDWSLLIPPLTWDVLSCNANENAAEGDDESTMKTQTVFGVSKEQYDKIIEVHDLEGLYGFEPMFSQVAVEVAEAAGICLADAFRYADSLRDYGGDFSGKEDDPEDPYYSLRPAIENLREAAHNEFFQFAFFKCNISVSTASGLDLRTGLDEDELMRLDPAMLHEYALIEDFNFKYFTKAYNYYMQHKPEDYGKEEFYQFLDMISLGHFVEEALEYVVPEELDGIDFTSAAPDYEEFEEYDSFRREEEENERWSGVRIDQEYDEENPEYL